MKFSVSSTPRTAFFAWCSWQSFFFSEFLSSFTAYFRPFFFLRKRTAIHQGPRDEHFRCLCVPECLPPWWNSQIVHLNSDKERVNSLRFDHWRKMETFFRSAHTAPPARRQLRRWRRLKSFKLYPARPHPRLCLSFSHPKNHRLVYNTEKKVT